MSLYFDAYLTFVPSCLSEGIGVFPRLDARPLVPLALGGAFIGGGGGISAGGGALDVVAGGGFAVADPAGALVPY
eukprot:5962932-Amphidinium_carterae.1